MEEKWADVYTKRFGGMWYPSEGCVKFSSRYLKRRVGIDVYDAKRSTGRILDAGCGIGRHVMFFAEQGFDVCGVDISKDGLEIANAWLAKKGLKADLRVGDIGKLPFDDGYFDVAISYGVLDHVPFSEAKSAINEIKRVLTPDGYLYITLRSTEDAEFGRGDEVDHNTFVLQEGYEKGIIQHFFDLEDIKELFEGLKIFDMELYEERFSSVFTVDKAYLQSSKGGRGHIDLEKPVNMNQKYSRWHISAEMVR